MRATSPDTGPHRKPSRPAGRAGAARIWLLCAFLPLLAPGSLQAAFHVRPGPQEISPEEKAIQADPEGGIQHGVILLEELERDDPVSGYVKTSYHLRAKILSNEARSLGDIEIPFEARRGWLREWWGRTIKSDGTVVELERDDLIEVTVVESQGLEARVLRAALPGVEPGAVIDFGYVFQDRRFSWQTRVPLQSEWPIRHFRYRWLPSADMPARYFVRSSPGVSVVGEDVIPEGGAPGPSDGGVVRVIQEKQSVVVEGWNLPPYESEPWMPPRDLIRSSLILYYIGMGMGSGATPDQFWSEAARRERARAEEFLDDTGLMESTLASMDLPEEGSIRDRLQGVNDWLAVNIRNTINRTAEEEEAAAEEARKKHRRSRASLVLEEKEGSGEEIDLLFLGFARLLGAEAHLVYAPDRRQGLWDRTLFSRWQLSERAVAVVSREGGGERITFTDPCSGLRFGQIPWPMSLTRGMLVTGDGPVEVAIPASDPRENILHSQATITWDEDGLAQVAWSAVGGGQRHEHRGRIIRWSDPHQRKEWLDALCGSSSWFEVSAAEYPAWKDPSADYQIQCEGSLTESGYDEFADSFSMWPGGEWFPDAPSFPDEERVHPVVFRYPFIDMSVVDVAAPPGFGPGPPPEPVKLGTGFASYAHSVTATESGFRVQRALAIVKTTIPREAYPELRDFLQRVERADRTRITFLRTEEEGTP